MAESQTCPNDSELQALINGTLSEESQARLTVHIDSCNACRERMELLTGGDSVIFPEDRFGLKATDSEALVEVMRALKTEVPIKQEVQDGVTMNPPSLHFLSPSADPRHLGRLATYEIIEIIGRGGMGTVFKARDPKLERLVTIKVLHSELSSNGAARIRFLREARSAAAITHEHVVTIHAVDEANGVPFLVMEYIVGVSLEDRIQRSGHLRVEEVLRIGMQAASGLAAAHAQGLVHRDIKPSNILLENGVERVKITDFGLARVIHEAQLTQSNVVAGTPQYMSPEQARGDSVDCRSDLFSLGCVLYAMCTGRSPFRADTPIGAIHRVCEDKPRPIREVNSEIPDWLVQIIDRLLVKDPSERFQSAIEVAELLGRHLAYIQNSANAMQPVILPPMASRHPKQRTPIRSHKRKLLILGTAAVIAVLVGMAVWQLLTNTPRSNAVLWDKNGHRYLVVVNPNGFTWNEAEQRAIKMGGHLVTITSSDEDEFVISLVKKASCGWHSGYGSNLVGPWIGAIRTKDAPNSTYGWRWPTGEPFLYSNWLSGQPDAVPEKRIAIHYSKAAWGSNNICWCDNPKELKTDAFIVEWDDLKPREISQEDQYATIVILPYQRPWIVHISSNTLKKEFVCKKFYSQALFLAPGSYKWEICEKSTDHTNQQLHHGSIEVRADQLFFFTSTGPKLKTIDPVSAKSNTQPLNPDTSQRSENKSKIQTSGT